MYEITILKEGKEVPENKIKIKHIYPMVVYNILPLKSCTNKAVKLKPGRSIKKKKIVEKSLLVKPIIDGF